LAHFCLKAAGRARQLGPGISDVDFLGDFHRIVDPRASSREGTGKETAFASGSNESLARTGGNITGLTNQAPELTAKRLELLKDAIPRRSGVVVLGDPSEPSYLTDTTEVEHAARALGVQILSRLEPSKPTVLAGVLAKIPENAEHTLLPSHEYDAFCGTS
jgi:hypothetical protein